jgi:hypothetical protein
VRGGVFVENKRKINAKNVASALGGAIIGAGIGAAATKTLSDKKTRKKLGDRFDSFKEQIRSSLDLASDSVEGKKSDIKEKVEDQKIKP